MRGRVAAALRSALEATVGEWATTTRAVAAVARRLGFAGLLGADGSGAAALWNGLHARMLLEAAEEISSRLTRARIGHFVAKGVALLERPYRLGDRSLADLDLYVRVADGAAAVEVLRENGYELVPQDQQSGPPTLSPGVILIRTGSDSRIGAVTVDLHWGLEPVDQLLPRPDLAVPEDVWRCLDCRGPFPVPQSAQHAAILVHHLAHHDLLHAKSLVDLAAIWEAIPLDGGGGAYLATSRRLGVERLARCVADVMVRDFGLTPLADVGRPPSDWRGRLLRRRVALPTLLNAAAAAGPTDGVAITKRRLVTRLLVLDHLRHGPRLLRDIAWPPRAFLSWRWPDAPSPSSARRRHLRQVLRKAVARG